MQPNPPATAPAPDPAGCGDLSAMLCSWASPAPRTTVPAASTATALSSGDRLRPARAETCLRWWPWSLASAAMHGLALAAVLICGLGGEPAPPPLMVVGSIDLAGLGGGQPAGGDGLESGRGGPAREADQTALPGAARPDPATIARTASAPTPEQTPQETSLQPPDPTPDPVPEPAAVPAPSLDARTPPPPRRQAVPKPRPKAQAAPALTARPEPNNPAITEAPTTSATGQGPGTGAGDGAGKGLTGEGPGKGVVPGNGHGGTGDGRGDGGLYVGEFGQGDGPRFRHRSALRYPDAAKRAGLEGKVRLRLDIDAEGVLRNVAVVEHTGMEFVEEALRAIKASTFYPARRQGRSEACNALLTIRFALG